MEQLTNLGKEFISEVKSYEKRLFSKWESDINDTLSNKKESLQLSGKLMEIDMSTGMLKVHYSEKLVTMLKDVR